jgi:hypothetical protein
MDQFWKDAEHVFPSGLYLWHRRDRRARPFVIDEQSRLGWLYRYPVFSPHGHSIAYVREHAGSSQLAVAEIATKRSRVLAEGYRLRYPAWSPDGQWIAYWRTDGITQKLSRVSVSDPERQETLASYER